MNTSNKEMIIYIQYLQFDSHYQNIKLYTNTVKYKTTEQDKHSV